MQNPVQKYASSTTQKLKIFPIEKRFFGAFGLSSLSGSKKPQPNLWRRYRDGKVNDNVLLKHWRPRFEVNKPRALL